MAVNVQRTRITGIIGVGRTTGATHLTLWSANYLSGCCQKRTAVVEWSGHNSLIRLKAGPEGKKPEGAKAFRLLDVDYYLQGEKEALASCIRAGYEEILIDFGPMRPQIRPEWFRCSKRILTAALSEWKLDAFLGFLTEEEALGEGWSCMAAFGSETIRREIEKQFRIPLRRIPLSADAFLVDRKAMVWFADVFDKR